MQTSGFSSYVAAAGVVEGVVMVLGGMGGVDSGIRGLGTGGTFTAPHSSVSTGLVGGDMDHIIIDRILTMEAPPYPGYGHMNTVTIGTAIHYTD